MREIKFRAKYFDKWYFGIIVTRKVKDKGRMRNIYILMGLDNENWIPLREDQYDTIGQFIGLHDKNGKEIYEGDIVKEKESGIIGYIAFHKQSACFRIVFSKSDTGLGNRGIPGTFLEVIGNIADNPELLKGGEE